MNSSPAFNFVEVLNFDKAFLFLPLPFSHSILSN